MLLPEPTRTSVLILLGLFLVLAGCLPLSLGPRQTTATIHWRTLEQGRLEAASHGLPCVVDFFAGPECPRCKALLETVYSDPGIVARLNREFIPVRINLNGRLSKDEQALADAMETGGECILLFLDPSGKIIRSNGGAAICSMEMLTPAQFEAYLDQALSTLRQ